MSSNERRGLVVKAAGNIYTVRDAITGERYECKIRGKLRLRDLRTTNPLTVGDIVEYEQADAVITNLLPRKNYIIRRSTNLSKEAHIVAANIDQAFLVVTIDYPKTSLEFIDRFLLSAEAYRIPVSLIINKMDLYSEQQMKMVEFIEHTYKSVTKEILKITIKSKDDINNVKYLLINKITLLSGNSGVGKSSIIRSINPVLDIKIGEISSYHNKGKHTTTFSEIFEIAPNTFIVDTPGIKGFGLVDIKKEEVSHFFPEIFAESSNCKFYNCTHVHEPGCAVIQAVEEGRISGMRYLSYLKIMEEDEGKYRK